MTMRISSNTPPSPINRTSAPTPTETAKPSTLPPTPASVTDGFNTGGRTVAMAAPLAAAGSWTPAPSLDAVRKGGGLVLLSQGMEGDAVRTVQQRLGLPPGEQDGRFGAATLEAVKRFQQAQGLRTPPGLEGQVGPTTLKALERSRSNSLNLQEQLSSPDSLISRAIGHSEGNRTLEGGKTDSYYGHTDPGNGVHNQGTFSYQHGASSPEAADRQWLTKMRSELPAYESAARGAGLDPNNPLLAASFFDLYTQAPLAATGKQGFLDRLPELARKGVTPENLAQVRVDAYRDPRTGQLDAPGFGNDPQRLLADQRRRTQALDAVVRREGLSGTTPPVSTPGTQQPGTGPVSGTSSLADVAAGRTVLREGSRGPAVEALQRQLVAAGHLTQERMNTGAGTFGPATRAAVESFQRAKGLEVDGVVGRDTAAALAAAATPPASQPGAGRTWTAAPSLEQVRAGGAMLSEGMQGEAVRELQRRLGLPPEQQDGRFGTGTKQAVQDFQSRGGLKPPPGLEGKVGKTTLEHLEKAASTPGVTGISARGQEQMRRLIDHARNNHQGGSYGDCMKFVWSYMTKSGYGKLDDWNDLPAMNGDLARGLPDYLNASPAHLREAGLQRLDTATNPPITNPHDERIPPGAIIVVAPGSYGTRHPTAGDIVVKGTRPGEFINDGPAMDYGTRGNWHGRILGVYVPE
jgi:peptidoglycan hydrolase-like protein with peptidoglycan-binding domain